MKGGGQNRYSMGTWLIFMAASTENSKKLI
jgi:hypothetical protein